MRRRPFSVILAVSIALTACAHGTNATFQRVLSDHYSDQFHRCVPLGWNAAPVDGSFAPAYSVQFSPRDVWLAPLWLGFVPTRIQDSPQGSLALQLLNALVAAGLAKSELVRNGTRYHLTERAFPYYFEGNDFGENPLHLPYLCYSKIVPDQVLWTSPVRGHAGADPTSARVAFSWHESSEAPWASDPLIQSHSVVLAPTRSPAVVTISNKHGDWDVTAADYEPSNALTSEFAWPPYELAERGVASATTIAPSPVDPKIEALAKEWLLRAQTGEIDRSQLSSFVNAKLRPPLVRKAMRALAPLGTLESVVYVGSNSAAQDRSFQFVAVFPKTSLTWVVQLDPHGKIDGFFFRPLEPKMHLQEEQLLTALGRESERDAKTGFFSGAILIAKNGQAIFESAYGLADRQRRIPNTPATRFRVGSMNKMFTAVAVLQLVQDGKIKLDDPVGKYLRDYPNREIASLVTVRELLTHTGGTGDIFGPQFDSHRLELETIDDYVNLYGSRGPRFPPGSRFEYSNYGYILLGEIIEKVSGESYYDYVHQNIYVPAGMIATGSEPESAAVSDRSVGYMKDGRTWKPNADTLPYRGTSAGGGYSTVADLLSFAIALQSNKLLNDKYTRMLTTGVVPMPSLPSHPRRYAFGFADEQINGHRCFGHNGGAPGMNGSLEICPLSGYLVAVLANVDPPAADSISEFTLDRLPLR
jgi:D-alanyl-D-alanine carboxypeptidase